ncbi:hypothetical protein AB0F93_00090 [Micromonospora tulbaghiae]|uniref:phage tail termination protein n=1 Tax=Micromonospora tulbaghiae TaxID=479978 RepID=UPI00332F9138
MTQPVERDFPDIERLLAAVFAPLLGGDEHVGNEAPDNLEAVVPFLRVMRVGGPRTALYDYPIVELALLTAEDVDGLPMLSRFVNLLLDKPPPHAALDYVDCDPGPRELAWGDNDAVRHWGATLFLETRKVRLVPLP